MVDASDAPMKILHSRMVMPVTPGPLTLYYPKWIPGLHEPARPNRQRGKAEIQRERQGDSLAARRF
jgi:hypothetical protein